MIAAEQVVAALEGGIVTTAINIPVVDQADLEVLGPFIPLAGRLGRLSVELTDGRLDRIVVAAHGPLSDYDTRLLTVAALNGAFEGRSDQVVNVVNAPLIAAERGIAVSEERFSRLARLHERRRGTRRHRRRGGDRLRHDDRARRGGSSSRARSATASTSSWRST